MSVEIIEAADGQKYVAVPLAKLEPDVALGADVFLNIDQKFLKYKACSDEIPSDRYNYFISKNVLNIFIRFEDLQRFMTWMKSAREQVVQEMVEDVGEEYRDIVEQREQVKETVFETFAAEEINSETVEKLQTQVRDFIEEVKGNKIPDSIVARLMKQSENLADHSLNVANLSTFMAMVLGHGNFQVLEDVYMGALLHDYGKSKIPPDVIENKQHPKYAKFHNEHPEMGAKLVKKLPNIRPAVVKIVLQHHEQYNGNGFPKGLAGDDMFGLAKIVQLANAFDNSVFENRFKGKFERYRTAIKMLEYDQGKQFDPEIVEKLIEPLSLAYGGYYKEAPEKDGEEGSNEGPQNGTQDTPEAEPSDGSSGDQLEGLDEFFENDD